MNAAWPKVTFDEAPLQIIDGGYCLFLNTGNVTKSGFAFSNCQFITEQKDGLLRKGKLSREDVIMTTRGTIGNVGYFNRQIPFENIRINSGMVIFRTEREKLLPSFLYQYLRSEQFNKQVNSLRSGAAQPQLPIRDIKIIELPLPPLPQQEVISEVISQYDYLIENNKRRIELLEKAARQLYKEWFVRFRFPGHEHVKIINGMMVGWQKTCVGELLTLQRGFDLPLKKRKQGNIPIYASTGINGYHSEYKVKAPGLVTGRSGSLGKVIYISKDFWPLNTALWVKAFKKVDAFYSLHLLRSLKLENYNGGAAVPTLNRNDVHSIETVLPPDYLLTAFSDYLKPIFFQIDNLTEQNSKLCEARDLLLPKLMSGEIPV